MQLGFGISTLGWGVGRGYTEGSPAITPLESALSMSTQTLAPYTGASLYDALAPRVRWDLSPAALVEEAVRNGEGEVTAAGALAVMTGAYTGRSPKDKFTVRRAPSAEHVDWTSSFNHPIEPEAAEALVARFVEHAQGVPRLYGFRGYVGRGAHRVPIALISELAWHCLMGRHMYVRATPEELADHRPEFTLLYLPSMRCDPARDGVRSEVAVVCDLERKLGVIGGTQYGGEEKKFFFYLLNYLLPLDGSFPMHCSANVGPEGDVSVIFGLSGTGKTTLSTEPGRRILGDDEHGWDRNGVFNYEGGCYAKLIRLSQEKEPLIWDAVNRPASVLENVPVRNGEPDFDNATVENTRGVYPLEALERIVPSGMAGHPTTVVFLTFDASGTLPPLAVLDEQQALYWFLAGYTAKVAGTERGLGTKPEPTFSACFGAPFLPWHPRRYVELLREYLRRHRPLVVLMNTGALGGPYGAGGERPPIDVTRTLLHAAQSGVLRGVPLSPHPQYGVLLPETCPGVPAELLDPRRAWKGTLEAYDLAVRELVAAFEQNVTRKYAGQVPDEILAAGPRAA
jgi:phosphoenolpyruvate carboxykinase (ATP)